MTLSDRQALFTSLLAQLILAAGKAVDRRVRLRESYRPPELAAIYAKDGRGIKNSLHCDGLAADIAQDRWNEETGKWEYCTDSESYEWIGDIWKSLHPDCAWGGEFKKVDGNHFSLRHGGRA